MKDGFMARGAQNLDALHNTLMQCPGLSQWHTLITEIVESIKFGRHRVAIPAALTVMEGYIAKSLVRLSVITANHPSPVKMLSRAGWHKQETYYRFFWKSGMVFLEKLFAKIDFTGEQPTFINRHWILHGRSSVDWTTADALRLLNSLATIHFLFEEIGGPQV
jgi:hypothetical protein